VFSSKLGEQVQNSIPLLDGASAPESAPIRLVAVHDESGKYGADRFFVSGFVYVQEDQVPGLVRALREAREAEDYWREIHYCRVGEVDGRWGAKFRTASAWLDAFEAGLVSGTTRAAVLAVDCRSPSYDHGRFRRRPHFAYNRFTRMALEAGIRWLFDGAGGISLRILSDGKSRRAGGDDEDPDEADNFCSYLPRIARRRIGAESDWPDVRFSPGRVEEIHPGRVHRSCSNECELVQLADLVVSSVGAALRGPSGKPGKRELARRAAGWVRDSGGSKGRRRLNLFRRFSASLFVPGGEPAWPKNFPLSINPQAGPGQMGLF